MNRIAIELAEKVLEGDVRAAARLMRAIEDGAPEAIKALNHIYPHTGKAHVIGVTGAPGVGKSTLVDRLIDNLRQKGMTVGVVAIDPSSPFTGGALLGDRVRMQDHSTDEGVFIRSLATRDGTGGLSKATISTIHVMDAMNKDVVLVETVGVGQAEVDITRVADTSVLIMTPRTGDAIQMMKAGILEVADIFAINKADQEGADELKAELQAMLGMKSLPTSDWEPAIVLTEAVNNRGTEELVAAVLKHREYLLASGGLEKRRRQRAELELMAAIETAIKNYVGAETDKDYLAKLTDELVRRKTDPGSAALALISRITRRMGAKAHDR